MKQSHAIWEWEKKNNRKQKGHAWKEPGVIP